MGGELGAGRALAYVRYSSVLLSLGEGVVVKLFFRASVFGGGSRLDPAVVTQENRKYIVYSGVLCTRTSVHQLVAVRGAWLLRRKQCG